MVRRTHAQLRRRDLVRPILPGKGVNTLMHMPSGCASSCLLLRARLATGFTELRQADRGWAPFRTSRMPKVGPRGKSSKDIGEILGIFRTVVDEHIGKACDRLRFEHAFRRLSKRGGESGAIRPLN